MGGIADLGRGVARLTGMQVDAPEQQVVGLDPGTQEMINQSLDRRVQGADQYAQEMSRGVPEAVNQFAPEGALAEQQAMRQGADPAYGEALRGAYRQRAGDSLSKIMSKNAMQSKLRRADKLREMSSMMIARQRAATQTNEMLVEAYNRQEMARAGYISSLFQLGTAGVVIGATSRSGGGSRSGDVGPGGFHAPDVGSSYQGNSRMGGYGLGVSDSGAGGYGNFPGAAPSRGPGLGGDYNF